MIGFRWVKVGLLGTAVIVACLGAMVLLFALKGGAPQQDARSAAPSPAVTAGHFVKYYVVPPTADNGQPEFLFDIAEKTLGSGDRAGQIFALTKGRLQPDGQRLTDPEHIEPGWVLILPNDAAGPGVRQGWLPTSTSATGGGMTLPLAGAGAVGVTLVTGATVVLIRRRRRGDSGSKPKNRKHEHDDDTTCEQDPQRTAAVSGNHNGGAHGDGDLPGSGYGDGDHDPPPAEAVHEGGPGVAGPVMPPQPPGAEPRQEDQPEIIVRNVLAGRAHGPGASVTEPFPIASDRQVSPRLARAGDQKVHEVGFADDLVTLRLSVAAGAAVAWRPLPHDAPGGLAVVCVGAAPKGCLFLDIGTAPGLVAIEGPAEAAERLAEVLVQQLVTDPAGATVALVGDALAEVTDGSRVRRVPNLGALTAGQAESDLVIAILPAGGDVMETVPRGGPRIVRIKLGGGTDAVWSLTVTPRHAERAWSHASDDIAQAPA